MILVNCVSRFFVQAIVRLCCGDVFINCLNCSRCADVNEIFLNCSVYVFISVGLSNEPTCYAIINGVLLYKGRIIMVLVVSSSRRSER